MTAATAALTIPIEELGAGIAGYPMADSVVIYKGTLVALNASGLLVEAADTAGYQVVGFAEDTIDNTITGHSAGAWPPTPNNWMRVRSGCAGRVVAAGMTQAKVGQVAYVTDDATVGLSSVNLVPAGKITKYESATVVWVFVPPHGATMVSSGNAAGGPAGTFKTVVVALTGGIDTGGGLGSWVNPEAGNIFIEELIITSQEVGGHIATAACNVDGGTTATSATTSSDNLIDGLDIHSALITGSNFTNPGANGKNGQTLATGKWVTFSMADAGASAGFIGSAIISYTILG